MQGPEYSVNSVHVLHFNWQGRRLQEGFRKHTLAGKGAGAGSLGNGSGNEPEVARKKLKLLQFSRQEALNAATLPISFALLVRHNQRG